MKWVRGGMRDHSPQFRARNRNRHPSVESKVSQSSSSSAGGTTTQQNGRKISFAQQKELEDKKGPAERPVHRAQDSLFSTSSGWTNYRGFFNLAMLLLFVSNGRVALENLIKYGILITPGYWLGMFINEESLWQWPNLLMALVSNFTILTVFTVEKLLEKGWINNRFAACFYPLLIGAHLIIPAVVTLTIRGHPLFAVMTLGIVVIEALKMVSYVQVNYWARCARAEIKEKKDGKSYDASLFEMASLYPGTLTLSNLYYFCAAPTLCYELKYPRSMRRRKMFILKRMAEFVILFLLCAALLQQWVAPLVRNSMGPLSEMEVSRCIERLMKLAIPNIFIWLIFFYTFFHSGLNLVAELMRFADREFYRDFWNAETIQYFWKTWNIPVHRFAVRHIYMPMIRNNYSKKSAMMLVFFVSAFLHEYLVSVPLCMFRMWAYYGMMAQIPLSFITDNIIKGGRAGNIIVWLSLIVGQPLAILMYVHDWYIINHPEWLSDEVMAA